MKSVNATKLHRKSGGTWGTRPGTYACPVLIWFAMKQAVSRLISVFIDRINSALVSTCCARYDTRGRLLLRYTRFHHGA
jgi:hypothetical protein